MKLCLRLYVFFFSLSSIKYFFIDISFFFVKQSIALQMKNFRQETIIFLRTDMEHAENADFLK